MLHEVDVMRSSMVALSGLQETGLSIAASLTVAEFLLPRWLGELNLRRQDVRPHLRVVNSETVASLVRLGQVDIGFIETSAAPSDLSIKIVRRNRLEIVVRPDHPWARRK